MGYFALEINNILKSALIRSSSTHQKALTYFHKEYFIDIQRQEGASEVQWLHPAVIEFIQWLYDVPEMMLVIFSDGVLQDDELFVGKLFKKALGKEKAEQLKTEMTIKSRRQIVEETSIYDDVSSLAIRESKALISKPYIGCGEYKKDLNLLVDGKTSLEEIILIDNTLTCSMRGQERNLCKIPVLYFDCIENILEKGDFYIEQNPEHANQPLSSQTLHHSIGLLFSANQIFYAVGLLSTAFEEKNKSPEKNILDILFELQFFTSTENKLHQKREPVKDFEFCVKGLETLRKYNKHLEFVTYASLKAGVFKKRPNVALNRSQEALNIELFNASYTSDITSIQALLDEGAEIESRPFNPKTALIAAANYGYLENAAYLLSRGANVNAQGDYDRTPLIFASMDDSKDKRDIFLKMVQLLVSHQADINAMTDENKTALIFAADNGNKRIVQYLLSVGANPNQADNTGKTVMMHCATKPAILAMLIHYKGDVLARDNKGLSVIQYARENKISVDLLCAAGADRRDLFKTGMTELMYAVMWEDMALLEDVLIYSPELIDAQDEKGMTALMMAASTDSIEMVQRLLGAGAKVDTVDIDGKTALIHAYSNEVIYSLIAAGANINVIPKNRYTVLYKAVHRRNLELVSFLIKQGVAPAVLNTKTKGLIFRDGATPLWCILEHLKDCRQSQQGRQIADILIEAFADPNIVCGGLSCFQLCAFNQEFLKKIRNNRLQGPYLYELARKYNESRTLDIVDEGKNLAKFLTEVEKYDLTSLKKLENLLSVLIESCHLNFMNTENLWVKKAMECIEGLQAERSGTSLKR